MGVKALLCILLLILLTSCVSMGRKVDQNQLSGFVKGKTTYDEVIRQLGKPTQSMINSDGTRTLMYFYSQHQMNPANFIPYVGMFVGGSQSENTSVMLNFDHKLVLVNYSASEGGVNMGTGIISGQKQ